MPIQVEHDADHAQQSHRVDQHAEQPIRDEALNGFDIVGYAADQVASALLIMKRERQFLNMRVDSQP